MFTLQYVLQLKLSRNTTLSNRINVRNFFDNHLLFHSGKVNMVRFSIIFLELKCGGLFTVNI